MNNIKLNGKADMFIIPNSAPLVEDLFEIYRENSLLKMTKMCQDNGLEFNELCDHLVETWLVGCGADNMVDHGFIITSEDGVDYTIRSLDRRFPSTLLIGIVEGDTFNVKLNDVDAVDDEGRSVKVDINLEITAAQGKYRYRNFGDFEYVLHRVCI